MHYIWLASLLLPFSGIVCLNLSFSDNEGIGCNCHCHHTASNNSSALHENDDGGSSSMSSSDRALSSSADVVSPEAFSRHPSSYPNFDQPKTLFRPSALKREDTTSNYNDHNDDNDNDDKTPADDVDDHDGSAQQVGRSRPSRKGPMRITIVFESLCRFSRYHIVSTFWDVVKALPNNTALWSSPADDKMWQPRLVDNLLIELLPFGNAEYDSKSGSMACQNGPHECFVDRIQACILKHVPGKEALEYVVCTAYNALQKDKSGVTRNTSLKEFERHCFKPETDKPGDRNEHFTDLVLPCVNSTEPKKLYSEVWNRLTTSAHQFVPWVEINDEYKDRARHHLLDEICAAAHERDSDQSPSMCKVNGQGHMFSSRSTWDVDESSVSLRPWRLRKAIAGVLGGGGSAFVASP